MALFGNVSASTVELKQDHTGLGWVGPKPSG